MDLIISPQESLSPKRKSLFSHLRSFDALNISFLLFLSVVTAFFAERISSWGVLIIANCAGGIMIYFIALPLNPSRGRVRRIIRDWYITPLIFMVFKEVYVIIQSLGRNDFDFLLIKIDRMIFGGDPTIWIQQYTSPLLTEILQLAYAGYFIIMFTVALELYLRKEWNNYSFFIFTLMFGFFLSYVGYLLVPAIGPRFTLHDFTTLDRELPGIFLAVPIRDFLNAAESIPKGVPDAWKYAQRDVFPSGHTAMTLIALFFASKFKLKSRWYLYFAGALLLLATVYLRYHYVIDLLGGGLTMMFTVWAAPKMYRWWERMRN